MNRINKFLGVRSKNELMKMKIRNKAKFKIIIKKYNIMIYLNKIINSKKMIIM